MNNTAPPITEQFEQTENKETISEQLLTTLNKAEAASNDYVLQQKTLNDNLIDTCKTISLLMKGFEKTVGKADEKTVDQNNMLTEKIKELDLYIHALKGIPVSVEKQIIEMAPKIGEQVILQQEKSLDELNNQINDCNNSLSLVKANVEDFQRWRYRKTITIVSVAAIIAMLASTGTTYFIFKNNLQKADTKILKANNVHADGVVHVFDMTGKFCSKAVILPKKK